MRDDDKGKGRYPYDSGFKPYVEMGEAQKNLKEALARKGSTPRSSDPANYVAPANYTKQTAEQVTATRVIAEKISAQLEMVIELMKKLVEKDSKV